MEKIEVGLHSLHAQVEAFLVVTYALFRIRNFELRPSEISGALQPYFIKDSKNFINKFNI